jgi:hypothetical protein
MAVSIEDEKRLAEMYAEWFVRDYLTVDGDDTIEARTAALLPVVVPDPEPGVVTYVEWIDTIAVGSPRPGVYAVEVAYSLLVSDGGPFSRQPVGGLAIAVAIGSNGEVELADLPAPVEVPPMQPLRDVPGGDVLTLELAEGVSRPAAATR